jgi:hypothetical protein
MDRLIRTYNVLNTEMWQQELPAVGRVALMPLRRAAAFVGTPVMLYHR